MSIFKKVAVARPQYSKFDLSHNRKLSCRIGELVPVLCEEVMPGDKWVLNTELFARFAPMIAPMMHRIDAYVHFFFVPMRLMYEKATNSREAADSWEKFITGQNSESVPWAELNDEVVAGSLSDHLGIPLGLYSTGPHEEINVMPHMAYMQIWNDYYRDENLETEVDLTDSAVIADLPFAPLKLRAWEKDYFTSAWPWLQKGVASAAQVVVDPDSPATFLHVDGSAVTGEKYLKTHPTDPSATEKYIKNDADNKNGYIDQSMSIDIQELRRANRYQIWAEKVARAGSRYIEYLRAVWGSAPNDSRLQRAEYIGGGVSPVQISDVTNTSGFVEGSAPVEATPLPMGHMAGKGMAYGNNNQAFKKCDEHGYIMAILSFRPEAVYFQGLHRKFSKITYLDFPIPDFANLGEQAVLNKEIYFDDVTGKTLNDTFFGYQSRYAEYKFIPNTIHGAFRTAGLDPWTMARKFTATPDLNAEFIHVDEDNDDLQRVFAVEDVEHIYVQLYHRIEADRPLPFFNIPSLE